MSFGVMMTPALVVDGKVKVAGRVPSVDDLKRCKETQFDSEIVDTFLRIKKISQGEY